MKFLSLPEKHVGQKLLGPETGEFWCHTPVLLGTHGCHWRDTLGASLLPTKRITGARCKGGSGVRVGHERLPGKCEVTSSVPGTKTINKKIKTVTAGHN